MTLNKMHKVKRRRSKIASKSKLREKK